MKKTILILLTAFLAVACCNRSSGDAAVTWGTDSITRFGTNDVVGVLYPVAKGGPAADSMNKVLIASLRDFFVGEENAVVPLGEAIDTMLARKNRDEGIRHMEYMLQSEGSVYTNGDLTSVWLLAHSYTGGAHGISSGRYFNFDNRDGSVLTLNELFTDTARLAVINRAAFDALHAETRTREDYNYLFTDPAVLPLPANIGFDSTGVRMFYNTYEIAAYAFGATEYTIPYKDVASILGRIAQPQ